MGLPQTVDSASTKYPQGSQRKSFPFSQPAPATVKLRIGRQSHTYLQDPFHAVNISVTSSLPLQHCPLCTPQYGTLPVSPCIFFFFLRHFQWENQKKGGGEGNFLITIVVLLCPMNASINELEAQACVCPNSTCPALGTCPAHLWL